MRRPIIGGAVLGGVGLALFFLLRTPGPEPVPGTEEASAAVGHTQAAAGRAGAVPQPESPEDMGVRGSADAGSTPSLAQVPSEEDGVLEVEVLAEEQPVPGASVRLYWRGTRDPNLNEVSWRLASARGTDGQGLARLASRPGSYLVAVRAQGYGLVLRDVVRPYGESRTFLRISLESGQILTGRTVEEGTREPLPLVELVLTAYGREPEVWQSAEAPAEERVYAASDERGNFRVEGLAPGNYLLEARAVGHVRAVLRRVMVPAASPLTVALHAAGVIEGFVVDAHGAPAAGAEVHVGGRVPEVVTTGQGGGFSVEVDPGTHIVSARRGDEAGSLRSPVIVSAGKTVRELRIQLGKSAVLEGRVMARATGAPIEGAKVDVSPYGNSGDSGRAVTDGTGRFSVGGLAPGSYDLVVNATGFASLSRRALTVSAGESFPLELQLMGTGAVEGQVRDAAGQPVAGAQVVSSNRWGGVLDGTPVEARTDVEGLYRLEGLPAGPVSLTARGEGATIGVRQVVDVVEGDTAQLDFILGELGTVEGRVRPASGSLPTESLIALAFPKAGSGTSTTEFRPRDVDATGAFRMTLPPGTYDLRVALAERWPFGESESTEVEIEAGKTVQVELTWQSKTSERDSLRGTVVEPDGHPCPEAFVTLLPDEGVRGPRMNTPTDEEGRFAFSLTEEDATTPNRLKLIARSGGRIGELRGVKPGEQHVVVRLRPAVSVRGRVIRTGGGAPVKGFTLSVESQDLRSFLMDHSTREFPGDRFELHEVPAEPVRLTVRTPEGLGGTALVTPASGAVAEVEIPLQGTASVRGRVLDVATQEPVSGALFFIAEDRPLNPEHSTGADGRFTLEGVPLGEHILIVLGRNDFKRVRVTLVEGQTVDVGDILVGQP
ncbi:carboxypeptidase regulatory-like domain-containing protein [Hyalangium sp.]|uniref:carboxypeptidase regulatory-like domain-containing protein n=1 Tax=Hyalangium sp. TaxID=2028555 RepID=UPI002D31FA7A|nr:carboxypeptidase regulatory-like domain-containing protein [Hyalangium sp.]HYH98312.1 carboxypeptidase regulatory-like domain-containing protein [Hyalangium sp.]